MENKKWPSVMSDDDYQDRIWALNDKKTARIRELETDLTALRQREERLVELLKEANKVLEDHPAGLYTCNKGEYILALSKRITAELNHARGQAEEG